MKISNINYRYVTILIQSAKTKTIVFLSSGLAILYGQCDGRERFEREHCDLQVSHSEFRERLRLRHFLA